MNTDKRTTLMLATVSTSLALSTTALLGAAAQSNLISYERYIMQARNAALVSELIKPTKEDTVVPAQTDETPSITSIVDTPNDNAAAPIYTLPLSEELQEYTYEMCRYHDIEDYYEVVLAVMWRESNFTPDAISSSGDYGIMQINTCNHVYLKDELGIVDILDTKSNIKGGIYLLSKHLHTYDTTDKALMAYNIGPGGAAKQWRNGNYTSAYSRDVLSKAELIELDKYSEK